MSSTLVMSPLSYRTHYGCRCHPFCEAVLEFSSYGKAAAGRENSDGLATCEHATCDGSGEQWDQDDDYARPYAYAGPAVAAHAYWDTVQGRPVVLCSECMRSQMQTLPPNRSSEQCNETKEKR